jgi:hypothetical protein
VRLDRKRATMADGELRMTRRDAAAYITQHYFPLSRHTLALKAFNGTGPRYQVLGPNGGGKAYYERPDLDEWAKAQFVNPTTRKKQRWAEEIARRSA